MRVVPLALVGEILAAGIILARAMVSSDPARDTHSTVCVRLQTLPSSSEVYRKPDSDTRSDELRRRTTAMMIRLLKAA
jgi:hypothetical protein